MTTTGGYVPPEKRRYQVFSHASEGNPLMLDSFDDPISAAKYMDWIREQMRPLNLSPYQHRLELIDAYAS